MKKGINYRPDIPKHLSRSQVSINDSVLIVFAMVKKILNKLLVFSRHVCEIFDNNYFVSAANACVKKAQETFALIFTWT